MASNTGREEQEGSKRRGDTASRLDALEGRLESLEALMERVAVGLLTSDLAINRGPITRYLIRGCRWTRIDKDSPRVRIRHMGGGGPRPPVDIEIRVDGQLDPDPIRPGQSRTVRGNVVEVHAIGSDNDRVGIEVTELP